MMASGQTACFLRAANVGGIIAITDLGLPIFTDQATRIAASACNRACVIGICDHSVVYSRLIAISIFHTTLYAADQTASAVAAGDLAVIIAAANEHIFTGTAALTKNAAHRAIHSNITMIGAVFDRNIPRAKVCAANYTARCRPIRLDIDCHSGNNARELAVIIKIGNDTARQNGFSRPGRNVDFAGYGQVAFPDYIKNVVCSEIYPTWEESAIVANTLAIISFALNRVYTEYYPSRGYSFNITNSTAIDQKYIQGRSLFENVVQIVDEIFNSYLRYAGFIEPLAAKFCNGTTSTCDGLSQWGSQSLAQSGATTAEILRNYYGDNIEIVRNVPVEDVGNSYPGSPLRQGDIGQNVSRIQIELNRISQNYPAIPKVEMDGVFGPATDAAVRAFQSIFSLTVDGIVGQATWYKLILLYVAVNKLGELRSEGQTFLGFSWEYPESIEPGETGGKVTHLQYMLSVIAEFIPEVPAPTITGRYGEETERAVAAFQTYAGREATGTVDRETWDEIYAQYQGIRVTVFGDGELFPFSQFPGEAAVPAFARQNGNAVRSRYQDSTRFVQYPGMVLSNGMRDQEVDG